MSLREKAMCLNSGKGIEFMEGKSKGDSKDILNKSLTIIDFDFIDGEDGEYAVFITAEIKDNFFFGGSVITKALKELEENKAEVRAEGLPIMLVERKSKKNRKYTSVVFYPEENSSELPF